MPSLHSTYVTILRSLLLSLALTLVLYGNMSMVHAQPASGPGTTPGSASCTVLSSGSTVFANYGAPYSFYGSKPLLIKSADCGVETAGVIVGDRNSDTYVYDNSYYWNGSRWVLIPLSGSPKQGDWIGRIGTGSIPLIADRTWYVAYTCQNVSGQWRCGCEDAQCAQKLWQVQGFVRAVSTPGGGQSGGTDGGLAYSGGVPKAVSELCPGAKLLFENETMGWEDRDKSFSKFFGKYRSSAKSCLSPGVGRYPVSPDKRQ